jgi:hypothetical protein
MLAQLLACGSDSKMTNLKTLAAALMTVALLSGPALAHTVPFPVPRPVCTTAAEAATGLGDKRARHRFCLKTIEMYKATLQAWPTISQKHAGEGLGLLENWLGCTLPESQQEGGLSVGAVCPQGASRWRDYPRRRVRARSFAP